MREVLTPEQRRQFAERMQNRWGTRTVKWIGGEASLTWGTLSERLALFVNGSTLSPVTQSKAPSTWELLDKAKLTSSYWFDNHSSSHNQPVWTLVKVPLCSGSTIKTTSVLGINVSAKVPRCRLNCRVFLEKRCQQCITCQARTQRSLDCQTSFMRFNPLLSRTCRPLRSQPSRCLLEQTWTSTMMCAILWYKRPDWFLVVGVPSMMKQTCGWVMSSLRVPHYVVFSRYTNRLRVYFSCWSLPRVGTHQESKLWASIDYVMLCSVWYIVVTISHRLLNYQICLESKPKTFTTWESKSIIEVGQGLRRLPVLAADRRVAIYIKIIGI